MINVILAFMSPFSLSPRVENRSKYTDFIIGRTFPSCEMSHVSHIYSYLWISQKYFCQLLCLTL